MNRCVAVTAQCTARSPILLTAQCLNIVVGRFGFPEEIIISLFSWYFFLSGFPPLHISFNILYFIIIFCCSFDGTFIIVILIIWVVIPGFFSNLVVFRGALSHDYTLCFRNFNVWCGTINLHFDYQRNFKLNANNRNKKTFRKGLKKIKRGDVVKLLLVSNTLLGGEHKQQISI